VIGLYVPGTSVVHRAPAGVKLGLLVVFLGVLGVLRSPAVLAAGLAVVAAVAALSRVGARRVLAQVRPVLFIAVVVGAAQVWLADVRTAVVVTGSLVVAVASAGLVTLTTRTEDLLDAVVRVLRPLRRVGVDPDRVGLVLALTIRTVPVLAGLGAEVRDARRARGAERSVRAFAVPLVIRAVRHADRLGEALAARGVDD
jgi:biotin transport system permease protein